MKVKQGYAGWVVLLEDSKSLLCSVPMIVLDGALIIKIELMSEDVGADEQLAPKIVKM
jgi:hypothetical protein